MNSTITIVGNLGKCWQYIGSWDSAKHSKLVHGNVGLWYGCHIVGVASAILLSRLRKSATDFLSVYHYTVPL